MSLHVYSAGCAWHGPIENAGSLKVIVLGEVSSLPVCPFCKSPLFQIEEEAWRKTVKEFEAKGNVNYEEFTRWTMKQNKCFRFKDAVEAFKIATGKELFIKPESNKEKEIRNVSLN